MKLSTISKSLKTKRLYSKPSVVRVVIDNQISMVMMSDTPPGDPMHVSINPFK